MMGCDPSGSPIAFFRSLTLKTNTVEWPLHKETYLPLLISPPSPLWKVTVFWLEKTKQTNIHTHTYKTGKNQLVIIKINNSNRSVSEVGGLLASSHNKVQKWQEEAQAHWGYSSFRISLHITDWQHITDCSVPCKAKQPPGQKAWIHHRPLHTTLHCKSEPCDQIVFLACLCFST